MKEKTSDIEWADFARGVADEGVQDTVRRRLEAGSKEDIEEVARWRRVLEVCRRRQDRPEPARREEALHMAKTMGRFYLQQHSQQATEETWVQKIVATLVFGGRAAAPAGVRSREGESFHWVFSADSYHCDVRLDMTESSSPRLDGQVSSDEIGDFDFASDVSVLIFADEDLIGSARCDELGEFHSDPLSQTPSSLHVLIAEKARLELPLSADSSPAPA